MVEISWLNGLLGGVLIGLSATLLLVCNGRIAGISGMVNGALSFAAREQWRGWFLIGLLGGAGVYEYAIASSPTPTSTFAPVAMVVGGLLVGIGTRMGNGCTSGHGVCGLGRLSGRSLAAVLTFIGSAIVTVFIVRHVLGA